MGLPNVGKSTLLNRLVGEHLSIVSRKAQTTWRPVTGILTEDGCQLIFLDTPGLLEPRDLLQESMRYAGAEALGEADVILVLLDPTQRLDSPRGARLTAALEGGAAPVLVAVNKIDVAQPEQVSACRSWAAAAVSPDVYAISARTGAGVQGLLGALKAALPPGPYLYDEADLGVDPVRFFAAELVRETVFERFEDEIPYSTFCEIEEFRESETPVFIRAVLYVERKSQKGILIGKEGRAIRALGEDARRKLEHFLGGPVYLDLWVKVLPKWRKRQADLRRFGMRLPSRGAQRGKR